ncbi:MAG TPA: FlgD immunoglobulin-like domain containing protein [bacterium]|nr:FlgD immunoglobulin-like domain containing protein [bacterium]
MRASDSMAALLPSLLIGAAIAVPSLLLSAGASAQAPYVDTGLTGTTPRPDPDLVIVREAYFGASGVDLTDYGLGAGHQHVQSVYFRLFVDNDAGTTDSFTGLVAFPAGVEIVGFITEGAELGGDVDDGIFTASDSLFGVGSDADAYSEGARGFETGSGVGRSEFICQLSDSTFAFGLNVTDGVDDFRVVIDYGDSVVADLAVDILAFEVGTLGGAVPADGFRIGDVGNPVVFGSGDFGEFPTLLDVPLTSLTAPVPAETVPVVPTQMLFILRDRGTDAAVDGYDTSFGVPLPDLYEIVGSLSVATGVTGSAAGLIYAIGQDGGLAVVNPLAGTAESGTTEDRPGSSVAVTDLPGSDSLFVVRDTGGDTMIDVLDRTTLELGSAFPLTGALTPVDIADGPDGQLYVLGAAGALDAIQGDGSGFSTRTLSPPAGTYAGLTALSGSRRLFLVRDTAGDSAIDTYDVDTGIATYDHATFALPSGPVGITDGPDGSLWVVGAGAGTSASLAEIDPGAGTVLATFACLDFPGANVAITSADVDAVVAVEELRPPGPSSTARAFPNPARPDTRIEFMMPTASPVRARVFDVRGRLVRTLARGERYPAGFGALRWDGRSDSGRLLPPGTYLYSIRSAAGEITGKVVLVR